jgi:hypothetical protein
MFKPALFRFGIFFTAAAALPSAAFADGQTTHASARPAAESAMAHAAPAASTWPAQVWMRVPFEPTAFPSNGSNHLLYELYLTNFSDTAIALDHVDVLDPERPGNPPVASFTGHGLDAIVQPMGVDMYMGDSGKPINVDAGATVALFMSVTFPHDQRIPDKLVQRVAFADTTVEGAPIGTHHTTLKMLRSPVEGMDWLAADGPGNGRYNHHRRGIFIRNGTLSDSRRFAIDWKQIRNGASFSGDEHAETSYYAYGKPVLAVADATVVDVTDGLPDNPPGHDENFHPTLPVTIDNAGGNTIVLDLKDGQYAHYYHLQPGSVRVKKGEHVRSGQTIARVGASGDAREPHLHFEVTTAIPLLVGEGVPYLIDHYTVIRGQGFTPGEHERELPLDDMIIGFDGVHINKH